MPIELFIFDIAGTTVRDNGFVSRAFLAAARSIGHEPDVEWMRARMGLDKRGVFREMLRESGRGEDGYQTLASHFESCIEQELHTTPPVLLPGAAETIETLAGRGVKIAFTTGFSARTAALVLGHVGWDDYVAVASDEVSQGRPAPDLIHEAMRRSGVTNSSGVGVAGDTPSDLQSGHAASCAIIVGVGHGTHTLEELSKHPHTHLIPNLSTLPEIVSAAL
ncbi:MAG: HAD hydrolase-like protein [Pyrinomonadaceae bacterium]|nr:HAD hydrolase-like protein [Phycisphaerales bacterium]